MIVNILEVNSKELIDAFIFKEEKVDTLPSMQDNWRFNFRKEVKNDSIAFVLTTEEEPYIIEGCMLFELKENEIPYLKLLEVAPRNFGNKKKYDFVAGCLIAYACKKSFTKGKGVHKGFLSFHVSETNLKVESKLKEIYCNKYYAYYLKDLDLLEIEPRMGRKLIAEYLER